MEYKLTKSDFKKAFEFGVRYYLDPSKGKGGRTSSEPRGFGGTLDAFTAGKLVEIGVAKMIEKINQNKKIILDFDLRSVQDVRTEPDIIEVRENKKKREPKVFIEIKRTQNTDRWIGVFKEQLQSIDEGTEGRKMYFIHARLICPAINNNYKSADPVGIYLNEVTKLDIFKDFAPLNAKVKLEFIYSSDELKKYGTPFPSGENTYETELFNKTKIFRNDMSLRANHKMIKSYNKFKGSMELPLKNKSKDAKYGLFDIKGDFDLIKKENLKTTSIYIYCRSKVIIENDVFGKFELNKEQAYCFNLLTVGRDPKLKRNNLWIAKRRMYQLIQKRKLKKAEYQIEKIAKQI